MFDSVRELLNYSSFAVAGSFSNRSKFAYKILKTLISGGKEVYPVNPRGGTVDDLKCWESVSAITEHIEVVCTVTPGSVTEDIVLQCVQKGIRNIWMQPGSETGAAIELCNKAGINIVYNTCILLKF